MRRDHGPGLTIRNQEPANVLAQIYLHNNNKEAFPYPSFLMAIFLSNLPSPDWCRQSHYLSPRLECRNAPPHPGFVPFLCLTWTALPCYCRRAPFPSSAPALSRYKAFCQTSGAYNSLFCSPFVLCDNFLGVRKLLFDHVLGLISYSLLRSPPLPALVLSLGLGTGY